MLNGQEESCQAVTEILNRKKKSKATTKDKTKQNDNNNEAKTNRKIERCIK